MSDELWKAVQAARERTRQRGTGAERAKPTSPLRSLITDELNRRYEPVHTTKVDKRYRYYVSKKEDDAEHDRKQGRLPADALEQQVADRLVAYLCSPHEILSTLVSGDDDAFCRERLLDAAKRLAATHDRAAADWMLYRAALSQIVVRQSCVDLVLDQQAVRQWLGESEPLETSSTFTLTIPVELYRTGHDLRLMVNNGPGQTRLAPSIRR